MSVKGKMSRSSLGQVMPVHADPLGFTNASFRAVNQVTFSYRTNTDAAAALLPTELEIDENPKISVMFLSYGFTSVGPFPGVHSHHSRALPGRGGRLRSAHLHLERTRDARWARKGRLSEAARGH